MLCNAAFYPSRTQIYFVLPKISVVQKKCGHSRICTFVMLILEHNTRHVFGDSSYYPL